MPRLLARTNRLSRRSGAPFWEALENLLVFIAHDVLSPPFFRGIPSGE
jgi:hypothetical protein